MTIIQTRNGNNFDALRLLLASMVVVSHGSELVTGDRSQEILTQVFHTISFGDLAVDGFFVLSGYLIAKSWIKHCDLKEFVVNRAARILPGFVVAFVLSSLVFPLVSLSPSELFGQFPWKDWAWQLVTLSNPLTAAPYGGHPYPSANGSLWTIRFEVLCYGMIAFLGLLKVLSSPRIILACFLGSLVGVVLVWHNLGNSVQEFQLFRLISFYLAGTLFSAYEPMIPYPKWWAFPACAMFIISLVSLRLTIVILPLVLAYCLFGAAQVPNRFRLWLARYPDISYGTYLYGWPATKMIVFFAPWLPIPFVILGSLVLALGAGHLSWHWVEKRPMELRKRLRTKPSLSSAS